MIAVEDRLRRRKGPLSRLSIPCPSSATIKRRDPFHFSTIFQNKGTNVLEEGVLAVSVPAAVARSGVEDS